MSEYFPEPKCLEGKVKVDLDLSNYATKTYRKNAIGIDTSSFGETVALANKKNLPNNLSNLKSKLDK